MRMPVQTEKKNGRQESFVEPTDKDLQEISDQAAPKAAKQVAKVLNTTLGVNVLDLKTAVPELRRRLRDPEVDNVSGTEPIPEDKKQLNPGQTTRKTHRYTIDVPDEGEHSVLNLGHGDPNRDLPDAGISARTKNHIHFHTKNYEHASMIALGGPTSADRRQLDDPADALGSNTGISAITNGHLWAESLGVANVASRKNQAILRSHLDKVRVHADLADVELASAKKVIVGGMDSVNIVSNGSIDLGSNAYGVGFGNTLSESASWSIDKDGVSCLDWLTSGMTTWQAFKPKDEVYKVGLLEKEVKKNDMAKIVKNSVDGLKVISSVVRQVSSKYVGGKVSISAGTFASMSGGVAASMYGPVSATVSSVASASVVGGTAGLKGLAYASVWAGAGVSVRTLKGAANLRSDKGAVGIDGHTAVNVVSAGGVNIGGDTYAELKCGNGPLYLASSQKAALCVGKGAGMGVIVIKDAMFMGTVSKPDSMKDVRRNQKTGIEIDAAENTVKVFSGASGVKADKKKVAVNAKKAHIC